MTGGDTRVDELDRRIIAALQADGRASWTDLAERVGSSLATVTRRGQQLLASGVVAVGVSHAIHTPLAADLFVLRIRCRSGRQMDVAKVLAERRDLRFLCLVTGANDLVAEIVIPKLDVLHARLIDEIQAIDGVETCRTDLVLHQYKVSQHWLQSVLARQERGDESAAEPHVCDPSHFGDTDRQILEVLKLDGRASFRSVADEIGVNESTVRRRFEAMIERGCAVVLTLVSAPALGFEAEILLNVSVSPARLDDVARALTDFVGVRYLAATLDCSLMCELILPSTSEVYSFLTQVLGRIDGVLGWEASLELLTITRGFLETPWWRAAAVA
ncbi:DNA-binding Lrp family transcriptional regulator [Phycicoccus duodecadis]|uniref:DNA-binding Lrp family transcriptional regulator n=1 Tax=Phycicoccus duodecadis TaxID=173053 RepID=A0A2N3YLY1_9MICO|nr:DNA-binding Lrp family transcriptional regulator [Phycicoccus duodecadis]